MLLVALTALAAVRVAALVPLRSAKISTARASTTPACDSWSPFGSNCKPAEGVNGVLVNEKLVTSKALREVEVVGASGDRQQLLSVISEEKPAVVVFLRHLG